MSRVDTLLSHLENVRQTGPSSWSTRCPAHADRTNSLSIADKDGVTLIHCFAGCTVHEVVEAVGIPITDLFPPRQSSGKPQRSPFPALPVLRAIAFEAMVVAAAGTAMLSGEPMTAADRDRLILAVSRIQSGLSSVNPIIRGERHA